MKTSLASLELAAITNELQSLVSSKISQIYHYSESDEFFFQLHTKSGKQFLRIVPGKFLNLTKEKKSSQKPSGFSMQLRKYLNNATIRKIYQKDSERILILEIEKEESYIMIIELIAPGNIILTQPNLLAIACLNQQKFRDRFIKPKEKYIFPKQMIDWKILTEVQLQKILNKSEKKNLATSLATEVGFGGLYSEEVCKVSGVDKDKEPKELDSKEIKSIIRAITDLLKQIKDPKGFIYTEQITPFELKDEQSKEQKLIKKISSYSEALDTIVSSTIASPYEKKIAALNRTIKEQEAAIKKNEDLIELNSKKAEIIYEKYQSLQKLLDIVKELKKTKDWKDIEKELKKEKKIKRINLKEKKIVVDL